MAGIRPVTPMAFATWPIYQSFEDQALLVAVPVSSPAFSVLLFVRTSLNETSTNALRCAPLHGKPQLTHQCARNTCKLDCTFALQYTCQTWRGGSLPSTLPPVNLLRVSQFITAVRGVISPLSIPHRHSHYGTPAAQRKPTHQAQGKLLCRAMQADSVNMLRSAIMTLITNLA